MHAKQDVWPQGKVIGSRTGCSQRLHRHSDNKLRAKCWARLCFAMVEIDCEVGKYFVCRAEALVNAKLCRSVVVACKVRLTSGRRRISVSVIDNAIVELS